jgi:tetratricopeptide (TPR) repeat protein
VKLHLVFALLLSFSLFAQETHNHPAPEKLGTVSFANTCSPKVQTQFNRAVALLHSFTFPDAEKGFQEVLAADPACAMAHWGIAMSLYHELWEAPGQADLARGSAELAQADKMKASAREQEYISALTTYYRDSDKLPPQARAQTYSDAMAMVAHNNPKDMEAQIFYALTLIATASPMDKSHPNQKKAVAILEPLYQKYPDHPGLAHYIIHACDSTEMAREGLPAARAYAKIAPSAPHALHMPSHIFTRLGYWDDSIASNLASRAAAHAHGDIGEELHAMDYLTYAYLQRGRDADAAKVVADLRSMEGVDPSDFKMGYAGIAMPVRYAVERRQWAEAAKIAPVENVPPYIASIAHWARALGFARSGNPDAADAEIAILAQLNDKARSGSPFWATQVHVQLLEAQAWTANARGKNDEAVQLLRTAADEEDSVEKLPVTPGPIVPAREQLGDLLLSLKRPKEALTEFEGSLVQAPGRRGALTGAAQACEIAGEKTKAEQFRAALK